RRLVVELARAGRFKGSAERRATLVVSVIPTARGAVLRDAGGARMATLGSRLPRGVEPRPLLDVEIVEAAAMAGDPDALLAGRWMSAMVARWLTSEPGLAARRYQLLVAGDQPQPAWCGGTLVPFPMCADAVPAASLIAPSVGETNWCGAAVASHTDDRRERARRRMNVELERAHDAPRLRSIAGALVALGDAPAPSFVEVEGGGTEIVEARMGESAIEAAERLYVRAKAMERAIEVLPGRIAALDAAVERAPADPQPRIVRGRATQTHPFRTYHSTSGLEIRVGRGAASNDELTFHESSPEDVWLHARDSAGAHVVLRWHAPEPPPARALEEAAILAAWHSKSRGSALVPVDWTRRKYVRKPRGSAPGSVVVQRSETVMVRPDASLERKLRDQ
ncbi:MAG TPA: NFACT RNA binding domain-containing protein, partial [Gemmatimonadaceae bacterium]